MNKNLDFIDKDNNKINANLTFSFCIDGKKYVILKLDTSLFTEDSKYKCLNIFEISYISENQVFITDVNEDDWPKIKDFLQKEIFNQI